MKQWAFHSQMYFLGRRLKDHSVILADEGVMVQDRSLYENAEIFARNLFKLGYISARDWDTYQEIYHTAARLLRPPDLVIYLRASVPSLVERIKKRGRDYERTIDAAYLENLNGLYEDWSHEFSLAPILTIPTEDIHYLENPTEYESVLNLIKQRLGGLPATLPT
jgi:deoxyadenosine/deoxycytidine kinase